MEQTRRAGTDLAFWSGRLYMWPGRALYVGAAADTSPHAHHAVQVTFALESEFLLRAAARERFESHEIALIGPDCSHEIDGRGRSLALLYLDPESAEARHLLGAARRCGFSIRTGEGWRGLVPSLCRCTGRECGLDDAAEVAAALLRSLAPSMGTQAAALDRRVAAIIDSLRKSPETRVPARDAAADVGLSSHRFQHLFRDATGIPFRRYQLWLRLIAAVEAVASGASLTEAAHAAGLSDSAHLSRTFRRNFGISPSSIARGSEFVQARAAPSP